jgi:hypothetical protein
MHHCSYWTWTLNEQYPVPKGVQNGFLIRKEARNDAFLLVRPPGFEPGLWAWKANVLDQARPRSQQTFLDVGYEISFTAKKNGYPQQERPTQENYNHSLIPLVIQSGYGFVETEN